MIHARAVWNDGQALKRGPIPVEHFSIGVSRVEVCRNYQGGGALDENDLSMQIPRDTHAAVCLKHKSRSAVVHEGKAGSNPGHASSVVAGRVLHRSCEVVRHGEDSQLERSWVLIVALLRQPILVDPVEGQKVHVIS